MSPPNQWNPPQRKPLVSVLAVWPGLTHSGVHVEHLDERAPLELPGFEESREAVKVELRLNFAPPQI
eukprot:12917966-Prorocentrum_lima.AAC.1